MARTKKAEDLTFDRIRAWLNDPEAGELNNLDREIYDRWDFAYDQLKIERPSAVATRIMKKYNVCRAQAYRDIQNCQKLLNPINRHDLEWIRNYIIENAMLQMKVAMENVDHRNWQKARADLLRIYALERSEKQGIDPGLLGRNEYFITINFGDKLEKINMNELHKMPVNKKLELTEYLFNDISTEDAKFILES